MSIRTYNNTRMAMDYAIVARKGFLKVYIPNGDELDAQWSVDYGDTWYDNGATAELDARDTDYVISFKYVEDYVQPPSILQRIAPGDVIDIITDPYQVDTDWHISLCSGGEVLSKARMSMTVSTFDGTSIESAIVKDGATMYVSGGGTLRTVYLQDGGNMQGISEVSGTSEVYPVLSDTYVHVANSAGYDEKHSIAKNISGGYYHVHSDASLSTPDFFNGNVSVDSGGYTGATGGGGRDVGSGGVLGYWNTMSRSPLPQFPSVTVAWPKYHPSIFVQSGGDAFIHAYAGTYVSAHAPASINVTGESLFVNDRWPFDVIFSCSWPRGLPISRRYDDFVIAGGGDVDFMVDGGRVILSSGVFGDSCTVSVFQGGSVTVRAEASGSLVEAGGYVDGDLTNFTYSGCSSAVTVDLFNSATLHYPAHWTACNVTHSARLEICSGHIGTLRVSQYASAVFVSSSPWSSKVADVVYEDGGYVDIPYGYASTWSGTPDVLCGATGTLHGSCGSGAYVSGGGHLIMFSQAFMSGGVVEGGYDNTASVTMSGGSMENCIISGNAEVTALDGASLAGCVVSAGARLSLASGASAALLTVAGDPYTVWWMERATATIMGNTSEASIGYGGYVTISGGSQSMMTMSGVSARMSVAAAASAWFDVLVVGSGASCSIGSGNTAPQLMVNGGIANVVSTGGMMVQSGGYATVLSADLVEADAGGATVVILPYGHVSSARLWNGGVISSASTCVIDEIDNHGGTIIGY